ncbi:radical SAM additional 4Fe4S-binding SPASM domain-containing protein [Ekhidna lutea]|uniref:Radical SAM additional 4Fe4S-binding SPASM domain-containing protein n=1 Tax=Ekhidna lutea TaxID=447679 RepID=A0A239EYB5_EKHLU|nr:radical SAM/SPASM domain-containing protein [Ekhidna lutea]SNS48892.1 radical SAM additional 4Fe4S-binding SPASM domain-containing protein [Ekhidna lutea]
MLINLHDSISLASKLTPKRISNAWRTWRSYERSLKSGDPVIKGLPISMAIEPTTACNLRCPECPSGLRSFTRPTGKLDTRLFEKIIEDVSDHLLYLTFYFQGEPYLNPQFLEMVEIANQHKIYTTTSTNAHFLDDENAKRTVESGLNRLIISIDGASQETYESYRKEGDLTKVLEGTKNILKWRKKLKSKSPKVVWQFLVVKPNEHEIPKIKRLAKEYGVDKVAFKTAQIYDFQNGNELIPTIDKYSRYRLNNDGSYSIKNSLENKCWKMWQSCVITWDGQVIPCCFDKDASHSMGNVSKKSFEEIWFSSPYQNFRNALLNGRSEIEICKNCTEGLKVWA